MLRSLGSDWPLVLTEGSVADVPEDLAGRLVAAGLAEVQTEPVPATAPEPVAPPEEEVSRGKRTGKRRGVAGEDVPGER